MSAAENEALLEGYLREVWSEGDPDAIERYVAPHYKRHMSPRSDPLDPAQQVERIKGIRAAFPDVTIVAEDVVAGDDAIAFRSTMRGTHRGEILGIAPTGRTVEVGLVDFIRIEDGRFAEQWGGPDMLDLARQLGATITAGG